MKITFEEFHKNIGLEKYPFNIYSSEDEKDMQKDLFINLSNYSPLKQSFDQGNSIILIGERGTGKTAITKDFYRSADWNTSLICEVDDFSELTEGYNIKDFLKFLIIQLSIELFNRLYKSQPKIKKLNKEEKIFLSYLLKEYVPIISKKTLKSRIENIQLGFFQKLFIKFYNKPIRSVLNYGATVTGNLLDDYLSKHFNGLPPITDSTIIKEFFPEFPLSVDDNFTSQKIGFSFLNEFTKVAKKLGFENTILLLDKIDEDSRFESNGEKIGEYIKPILTNNKLLLNNSIQIVISVWKTPFNYIKDKVRTQKLNCPVIDWNEDDLKKVLNKRLSTFSKGTINSYRQIFNEDVGLFDFIQLFNLCNKNPRDLWHLMHKIFEAQYSHSSAVNRLTILSVNMGIKNFIKGFNYNEYYPRKTNARANSMDFFSYTSHLLKLENECFTKTQLREKAGTGSSTNNYVVSMEKMGLITKHSKEGNLVTYKIRDPKIVYAIQKKIPIEKNFN